MTSMNGGTGLYLKLLIAISTLCLILQLAFQIVLFALPPYGNFLEVSAKRRQTTYIFFSFAPIKTEVLLDCYYYFCFYSFLGLQLSRKAATAHWFCKTGQTGAIQRGHVGVARDHHVLGFYYYLCSYYQVVGVQEEKQC